MGNSKSQLPPNMLHGIQKECSKDAQTIPQGSRALDEKDKEKDHMEMEKYRCRLDRGKGTTEKNNIICPDIQLHNCINPSKRIQYLTLQSRHINCRGAIQWKLKVLQAHLEESLNATLYESINIKQGLGVEKMTKDELESEMKKIKRKKRVLVEQLLYDAYVNGFGVKKGANGDLESETKEFEQIIRVLAEQLLYATSVNLIDAKLPFVADQKSRQGKSVNDLAVEKGSKDELESETKKHELNKIALVNLCATSANLIDTKLPQVANKQTRQGKSDAHYGLGVEKGANDELESETKTLELQKIALVQQFLHATSGANFIEFVKLSLQKMLLTRLSNTCMDMKDLINTEIHLREMKCVVNNVMTDKRQLDVMKATEERQYELNIDTSGNVSLVNRVPVPSQRPDTYVHDVVGEPTHAADSTVASESNVRDLNGVNEARISRARKGKENGVENKNSDHEYTGEDTVPEIPGEQIPLKRVPERTRVTHGDADRHSTVVNEAREPHAREVEETGTKNRNDRHAVTANVNGNPGEPTRVAGITAASENTYPDSTVVDGTKQRAAITVFELQECIQQFIRERPESTRLTSPRERTDENKALQTNERSRQTVYREEATDFPIDRTRNATSSPCHEEVASEGSQGISPSADDSNAIVTSQSPLIALKTMLCKTLRLMRPSSENNDPNITDRQRRLSVQISTRTVVCGRETNKFEMVVITPDTAPNEITVLYLNTCLKFLVREKTCTFISRFSIFQPRPTIILSYPVSRERSHVEAIRLSSYLDYPTHVPVRVTELARAGFYYSGSGDEVVCFSCGGRLREWERGDNPFQRHRHFYPECPYMSGNDTENVELYPRHEAITGGQTASVVDPFPNLANIRTSPDANSGSEASVLASQQALLRAVGIGAPDDNRPQLTQHEIAVPQIRQPEVAVQQMRHQTSQAITHSNITEGTGFIGNATAPELTPQAIPCQMRREVDRLATFANWPSVAQVTPGELARAGFFFVNTEDWVQCAFCEGILRNWNRGDQPLEEHRRYLPNCPFVLGVDVGNVPLEGQSSEFPLAITESQNAEVRRSSQGPENEISEGALGILTERPRHERYAIESVRAASYREWPASHKQQPEALARAGFFYAGFNDNVKCFFCDGGLKNWEADDDPWTEHARWFPQCGFVRQCKGEEFIREIVQRQNSPGNPPPQEQAQSQQGPPGASGRFPIEPREIKARMDTPMVQAVLDMGFNRTSVRQAIEQRLRSAGDDFPGAQDLLEATLEIEEEISRQVAGGASAAIRAPQEEPEPQPQRPPPTETVTQEAAQKSSADERSKKDKKKKKKKQDKPKDEEEEEEETKFLLEENKRLKEERICKICMDEQVSVVFLPCGHLVCCVQCAPALRVCAICRAPIRGTVRSILS